MSDNMSDVVGDALARINELEAALRELVAASIALEKTPGLFVKSTDATMHAVNRLIHAEHAASRLLERKP